MVLYFSINLDNKDSEFLLLLLLVLIVYPIFHTIYIFPMNVKFYFIMPFLILLMLDVVNRLLNGLVL